MKLNRLIIFLIIFCFSCNHEPKNEILIGDLYFSFFRIGNYYNQPDSLIKKYEDYFSTTNFETVSKEEKELFEQYKLLKKHDLLYNPFVEILTEKDSLIVKLYLEKQDYDKIKIYKRQDLQDNDKKVRIFSKVKRIDNKLYFCENLDSLKVIDGKTFQIQKKLRIEDYN